MIMSDRGSTSEPEGAKKVRWGMLWMFFLLINLVAGSSGEIW